MEERKYNQKYFIVFMPRQRPHWWDIFLDKEIYHCFLLTGSAAGSIEIQTSVGGNRIYCYKESVEKIALAYLQKGNKVVECFVHDTKTPKIKLFRNCVSICKDFIGMRNPLVITAKQLYMEVSNGKFSKESNAKIT